MWDVMGKSPLAQESKNNLAPLTVKLGNYSHWNRSRDFSKNVKQPLDLGFKMAMVVFEIGYYQTNMAHKKLRNRGTNHT